MLLMNKEKEILSFNIHNNGIDKVEVLNKELLPEMLKEGYSGALERWFEDRSIDLSRFNARRLLDYMCLPYNAFEIVIANKGLNLTDTYWIKDNDVDKFEYFSLQRRTTNKYIFSTALEGRQHKVPKVVNTELTNIGSFEKAWVKDNNIWYLVKKGSDKNRYAEEFTYMLGSYLNLSIAECFNVDNYTYSLNFTNEDVILEHYASYKYKFNDISTDEKTVYKNLSSIGLGQDYLNILLLDAIVNNFDRHEFNYGILKAADTGKLLGLAPNFDNNLAFGLAGKPSIKQLELYIREFGLQENQKELLKILNIDLIRDIDKEVRKSVNPKDLKSVDIFDYFEEVINIIKGLY